MKQQHPAVFEIQQLVIKFGYKCRWSRSFKEDLDDFRSYRQYLRKLTCCLLFNMFLDPIIMQLILCLDKPQPKLMGGCSICQVVKAQKKDGSRPFELSKVPVGFEKHFVLGRRSRPPTIN